MNWPGLAIGLAAIAAVVCGWLVYRTLTRRNAAAQPLRAAAIDLRDPQIRTGSQLQLSLTALLEDNWKSVSHGSPAVIELLAVNTGAGAARLRPGSLRLVIVDSIGEPLAVSAGSAIREELASGQEMLITFTLSPDQVAHALSSDSAQESRHRVFAEYTDAEAGTASFVVLHLKPERSREAAARH